MLSFGRRLRPAHLSALVVASMLIPIMSVRAADTHIYMPTLTVVGDRMDGVTTEGSGRFTAPAVTIGKITEALKNIPQSVSVVTRQRMDEQNLQTLGEVLEQTTGITVQDANSYERNYFARGFKIETIQYDGVPTQIGSGFVTQPDMALYDRVEVLRGPAGIFNGVGEPGGTVNLVRKRPTPDFTVTGTLTAGSWNNRRAEFDLSNRLNEAGTLRGRVVGVYQDRDFFYDVANTKKTVGYGILEYDFSPATTMGVGVSYEQNDMLPMYGGLPRYMDGTDLQFRRSKNLNAAWSRTRFERTTLFADLTHRFNDNWRLRGGITNTRETGHDQSGSNYYAVNPATGMGPTISAFNARFHSEQTAIDATLEGAFSAFGKQHDFIAGANFWDRDYDSQSQSRTVPRPAIDVFNFNPHDYSDFPTVIARAPTNRQLKTEQTGLYSSLRLTLADPLKLTIGGRFSEYRNKQFNTVTGQELTRSTDNAFIPYAAVTLALNDQWTAYTSYAEIFRSQATRFTADGSPLEPAVGKNYEVGIKGELYDGRIGTSLAVFRVLEENREQIDPNNPEPCFGSPTLGACYVADGKVRSQGIEAELNGQLSSGWNAFAGYTFNTTKYLQDRDRTGGPTANEGQPYSSFTPKHIFRLWTSYQLPNDLRDVTISGGVRVQSATTKTNGTVELKQGMYSLWDTRIGYRINRNLTTALNVNNIFDKKYYRTLGSPMGGNWYGEPRSIMLTLQAKY
ncbi:TonB-dependent siderophore receptor [Alcaligenaceae bacterium A4P071]|nr:TonB-dependent siderophore receptor [Alcaligenaceae bacterium A4P071]